MAGKRFTGSGVIPRGSPDELWRRLGAPSGPASSVKSVTPGGAGSRVRWEERVLVITAPFSTPQANFVLIVFRAHNRLVAIQADATVVKAIAYQNAGPLGRQDALVDVTLETPPATGRDLLVEVRAISVNPVDAKTRRKVSPETGTWKVLGWDAVGRVVAVGEAVKNFRVGDEVFYAGSLTRPGANAEFHLVDERIVGQKPKSLTDVEAAALPLTAITAWEMLFDRLDVRRPVPGAAPAILIVGGAGGVGSIINNLVKSE